MSDTETLPPRGDDYAALCTGEQVTICCGAYATISTDDHTLCCKACWHAVGLGRPEPPDEGDGDIGCTIEIFQRDNEWWMVLSGELFGPYPTDDAVIDAIPACLRSTF